MVRHLKMFIFIWLRQILVAAQVFSLHCGMGSLVVACEPFSYGVWDLVPYQGRTWPPALGERHLVSLTTREVP